LICNQSFAKVVSWSDYDVN